MLRNQNDKLINILADTRNILFESLGQRGDLDSKIYGGVTKPLLLRNT